MTIEERVLDLEQKVRALSDATLRRPTALPALPVVESLPIGSVRTWSRSFMVPLAIGADSAEFMLPYADDGDTAAEFHFLRAVLRLGTTPSSGTTSVQLQRSVGAGVFTGVDQLAQTLGISNGEHQAVCSAFASGEGYAISGDTLRWMLNNLAVGTAAWTLQVDYIRVR